MATERVLEMALPKGCPSDRIRARWMDHCLGFFDALVNRRLEEPAASAGGDRPLGPIRPRTGERRQAPDGTSATRRARGAARCSGRPTRSSNPVGCLVGTDRLDPTPLRGPSLVRTVRQIPRALPGTRWEDVEAGYNERLGSPVRPRGRCTANAEHWTCTPPQGPDRTAKRQAT